MNIQKVFEQLRQKGTRLTPIRKHIIRILYAQHLFSIPEITTQLQVQFPTVNKTTVYRQIDFLIKKNVVAEIDLGERKKYYELISSQEHHHHLICQKCEAVEHVAVANVEAALHTSETQFAEQYNFRTLSHSLNFFGFCKNCF